MIPFITQVWRGIFPRRRPWQTEVNEWVCRAIDVFDSPDFRVLRPSLARDAVRFGLAYCLEQVLAGDIPAEDPNGLVRELARIVRRSRLDRRHPTDQATLRAAVDCAMWRAGIETGGV